MASIKSLAGKRVKKSVKFMGTDIDMQKLTFSEVEQIQAKAKEISEQAEQSEDGANGLEMIKLVVRLGTEGGNELTDEDFKGFPLDEVAKLSNEIMKFSGINTNEDGKKEGKSS